MLDKEKVLRFYLVKAIKDVISEEISNNSLLLVDVRKNNEDFVDRVLMKYIEYTMPIFTVNEIVGFIRKTLGGRS
jgi:hypothetical protein